MHFARLSAPEKQAKRHQDVHMRFLFQHPIPFGVIHKRTSSGKAFNQMLEHGCGELWGKRRPWEQTSLACVQCDRYSHPGFELKCGRVQFLKINQRLLGFMTALTIMVHDCSDLLMNTDCNRRVRLQPSSCYVSSLKNLLMRAGCFTEHYRGSSLINLQGA